ncbi:MAG: hypothetical protein AMXMBFR13_39760 [Phycisphaerae bacterium]
MKFLIDRCAGKRLADWLRSRGHDVVEGRTLGPDPGDSTLLKWAVSQGRVLVTIDMDFGKLVFAAAVPHSGILRLPDLPASARIAIVDEVLRRYAHELEARAVVTVRGGRIRISRSGGGEGG